MSSKLMEYFNSQPRIGILSTADAEGKVDSAVLGSPHMTDEETVVVGLGDNRTLANLQEKPHAVFLIMEPGESMADWKGIRVYLRLADLATSGPALDDFKEQMAKAAGEDAAAMMHAVARFGITEVRPLIDMGQGWEASI